MSTLPEDVLRNALATVRQHAEKAEADKRVLEAEIQCLTGRLNEMQLRVVDLEARLAWLADRYRADVDHGSTPRRRWLTWFT